MSKLIRRGKHNSIEGYLGCRGSGKSVAAQRHLVQNFKHCYRLAHDPNMTLLTKLPPDNLPTGIVRHTTVLSIRQQLATNPAGIHAYMGETDPTPLVELGIEAAQKGLRKVAEDEWEGAPSEILIDEIAAWDEASAMRAQPGPTVRKLVGRCRPLHTGLIYTAQMPSMVHRWVLFQSTRLVIFRLNDQHDVERLVEGGVDREVAESALTLPYWEDKSGEGRKRILAGEVNHVVIERA